MYISAIFAFLIVGCTNLPSREVPNELGVKQVPGASEEHPSEFVFCDMNGGAWGCEKTTPKTPVSYILVDSGDDKPISDLVKGAIKEISGSSAQSVENMAISAISGLEPLEIVFFDFDSAELNAKAKITLLNILPEISGKKILINGYTDSVGSESYNKQLGLSRAQSVKDFFIKAKSDATEIETFGNGLCCYLEPNRTEEQRAKNRRVEIFVVN